MPNKIISTENLSIGYPNKSTETVIGSNINIEILEGELVAVIGINGVGKSTLLRSISGIQENLGGTVFINGKKLNSLTAGERSQQISLVLTEQPISKNLSVFELIALGRQPYTNWIGSLSHSDLRAIKKAINLVNIETIQHKKCYELSDGQLQKVLIARALAQNTPLIILDEPTTHLDLYHQAFVLKLLKQLSIKTHKTIVFSTHEINLALQLCDRLIVMQKNKVSIGSPSELVKNGTFQTLFPSDLILFDEAAQTFRIKS